MTKFIRFDAKNDQWILHKEPYATIEVATEEDFNEIKAAIEKQKPMKVKKTDDFWCPVCDTWLGQHHSHYPYCYRCGQKLDWSERR